MSYCMYLISSDSVLWSSLDLAVDSHLEAKRLIVCIVVIAAAGGRQVFMLTEALRGGGRWLTGQR
jgi:hypothetical protein